jgi:putative endopeptidase
MALETSLAAKHMKKEQTRDMMKLYNKYPIKDLKQLMPDFDWAANYCRNQNQKYCHPSSRIY